MGSIVCYIIANRYLYLRTPRGWPDHSQRNFQKQTLPNEADQRTQNRNTYILTFDQLPFIKLKRHKVDAGHVF